MKKMKKLNKIIISVLLITAFCGAGAVFAWFTNGDRMGTMGFKIAKIDSTVTLYKANDANFNGIPDLLYDSEGLPYTERYNYYDEKYSFDRESAVLDYARSESPDPADILLNISVTDMFPSKVFTYKFALENKSEASNDIAFRLDETALTAETVSLLSTFSLRTAYVRNDNEIEYNSNKTYLFEHISGGTLSETTVLSGVSIAGLIEAGTSGTNCYDFWLMVEMEPYDALTALAGFSMTEAEYNALQGQGLTLPGFRVYFEING